MLFTLWRRTNWQFWSVVRDHIQADDEEAARLVAGDLPPAELASGEPDPDGEVLVLPAGEVPVGAPDDPQAGAGGDDLGLVCV